MTWAESPRARAAFCALLVLGAARCKSADAGQVAAAAITLGAAVTAAAIHRAATDDCWGNCPPGTYCDRPSGMCVEPDESVAAPPEESEVEWVECDPAQFVCGNNQWLRCEQRCEWVMCATSETAPDPAEPERCCHQPCTWLDCFEDGRPCEQARTVPKRRTNGGRLAAVEGTPRGGVAAAMGAVSADPCRGLCLDGERCVVREGVADCVADDP